ncbi:MAG: helix-turn-helix transcriptional regulator, partial [Treponema sp.]|nr:helix-turn-helix transcriptional regulator [Treponema sp.]
FTKREAEILCLIMQKYSNTEIAEKLCLTKRTVENNISRIYVKTGLSTREELVRYEDF